MRSNDQSKYTSFSKKRLGLLCLYIIILFDVYCVSFFVSVKSCSGIGQMYVNFESFPSPQNQKPVYAGTTPVCIFENEYNIGAYYFYWPLHRYLRNHGYWHFVKDPQAEKIEYKNWFDQRLEEFIKTHGNSVGGLED